MLTLFLRAFILYFLLVLCMRAMGKRELGQFQPYEFVMAMLIANLVASPMGDVGVPLLHGILPIAALFVSHSLITLLSMRSDRMRAWLSGKPVLIISKGVVDQQQLKNLCLTLSDVMEGIRQAGILDIAEVGTAVVEANGNISAFPLASRRPPTAQELDVDPGYEGLPLLLIMDGRVQTANLKTAQLDEGWLNGILAGQNLAAEQVFFCSVDTQGRMTLQDGQGNLRQIQAIDPAEVKW